MTLKNYLVNINVSNDNEHKRWNATKYLKMPIKGNIIIKIEMVNGVAQSSKANTFKED